ncbi:MAG: alpha/beta fold hydrolase [Cellvibrionaceae bacterium]|nr:alpha/beta fold hydrolase [Cellvibrionaceae bacterium]
MKAVSLFCIPCAGASATMYLRWRRFLPEWIKLVPVELPGRGRRLEEPFIEDYDLLVSRLCGEMVIGKDGAWAIFGHSMGALLAFGITARLHSIQAPLPMAIFASASPAPAHRNSSRYPDTGNDDALIADLHKHGGTPREVFENPELLRLTLDTLRADYRVCASFNYDRNMALPVPIQVFAGRHDDIEPEMIEAWQRETIRAFGLHWFDGGHFFIRDNEKPLLRILEHSLKTHSNQITQNSGSPRPSHTAI